MAEVGHFLEERHLQDAHMAKHHQRKGGSHSTLMPIASSRMEATDHKKMVHDPSVHPPHHTEESHAASSSHKHKESDIDFAATSTAIMDALAAVDGHVSLTPSQKERAIKILKGGNKHAGPHPLDAKAHKKESGSSHEYLYYVIPIVVVVVVAVLMNGSKIKNRMSSMAR